MGNAESKLEEANYFLSKMTGHSGSSKEFMFNLSACLAAARSVMDVLLYDYGIKYGLFTFNDEIHLDDFRRLATSSGREPTRFYNWFLGKIALLKTDATAGFLSGKRHVFVHRGSPAMVWSLILSDTISFGSSFAVNQSSPGAGSATPNAIDVMTAQGPAGSASQQSTTSQTYTIPQRQQLQGYFSDYPRETVVDLCRKYVAMLESIVSESRSGFP